MWLRGGRIAWLRLQDLESSFLKSYSVTAIESRHEQLHISRKETIQFGDRSFGQEEGIPHWSLALWFATSSAFLSACDKKVKISLDFCRELGSDNTQKFLGFLQDTTKSRYQQLFQFGNWVVFELLFEPALTWAHTPSLLSTSELGPSTQPP